MQDVNDVIEAVRVDLDREKRRWALAGVDHSDPGVRRLYTAAAKAVGRVLTRPRARRKGDVAKGVVEPFWGAYEGPQQGGAK